MQEREPTGERASVRVAAAQRGAGTLPGSPEGRAASGHLWSRSYTQVGTAYCSTELADSDRATIFR
jgi:hypothetical protein